MEDLAVIKAPNHSISFGKNFVKFKRKKLKFIHHPRSVRIGKNCGRDLESNADFQAHE